MSFLKKNYAEPYLQREESRERIKTWFFVLLVIAFIYIAPNFREPGIFDGLAKVIITANVALLIALAVKDTNVKLVATDRIVKTKLENKIKESIQKENALKFDDLEKKMDEYNKRGSYYDHLKGRLSFNLIRNIILSIIFSLFFVLIYGAFSYLVNVSVPIPHAGSYLVVNILLALSILVSLYYFLISLIFIAQSFSD